MGQEVGKMARSASTSLPLYLSTPLPPLTPMNGCTIMLITMKIEKTIILVRHASTSHNENSLWQGRSDYSLNEKGRQQAERLSMFLKNEAFEIIFHSPMKRAIQTAEIIGKNHHAEYRVVEGFAEMDVGGFDGKKHQDIFENHPEIYRNWVLDMDTPIPGGESFNDVFERVKPGVEEIMECPGQNILVVGHSMVNRAILGHLLKMNPIPARKFRMDNGAFSKILIYDTPHGKHITVDSWNNTSHL
jgi:broad specificity phosphatase PhoE